jgi:hypothetical protein
MNRVAFIALAALLLPGSALAATKAPAKTATKAPATAPASTEQQDHAVQDFAVLASAMRSDKVADDVKAALMGCIYSNNLKTISDAVDKVIAANPGKVDRTKPDDLLSVMVAVCGYEPSKATSAPPAGAPAGR